MKKLSVVVLVLLLVSMVGYGATGNWEDDDSLPGTWMTTGNVGIGTTNPGMKLDVVGDIRVSSDKHMFFGSSGIKRLDVTYGGLAFYCDQGPIMAINSSSYLGIGTESPEYPLHVKNSAAKMVLESTSSKWWMYARSADASLRISDLNGGGLRMMIDSDGDVGIGTDSPTKKLEVNGDIKIPINKTIYFGNARIEGFGSPQYHGLKLYGEIEEDPGITINPSGSVSLGTVAGPLNIQGNSLITGKVGIGTTNPGDYELAVNGHIRTKEITVESDWSDFVFADDYKLMSLDKLEKHIKVNKSLPGIPTEKEVKENGVEVGKIQAKLLEKVEELTLYVIELKKENENLQKQIDKLRN